jgi:hypothetical protein
VARFWFERTSCLSWNPSKSGQRRVQMQFHTLTRSLDSLTDARKRSHSPARRAQRFDEISRRRFVARALIEEVFEPQPVGPHFPLEVARITLDVYRQKDFHYRIDTDCERLPPAI